MNPKLLLVAILLSSEIRLLKIRYKKIVNIILTSVLKKNLYSRKKIIKMIKEISINIIFKSEMAGPATIDIGKKANKIKKYFSI